MDVVGIENGICRRWKIGSNEFFTLSLTHTLVHVTNSIWLHKNQMDFVDGQNQYGKCNFISIPRALAAAPTKQQNMNSMKRKYAMGLVPCNAVQTMAF